MNTNRSNRKMISYILSLLISIFLSIFIVLTITRFTVMSPQFILKQMDKTDFYNQSVITLNDEIQQETQSTGFPLEMFENYLTTEDYSTLIESQIRNAFETGDTTIDTSQFETKLNQDIEQYISENNIIINTESENAIELLKTKLVDLYKSYMTFPYLSIIINIINAYQKLYLILAIAVIILIIIASVFLYKLHSHYKSRRRYFSYALSSSGLMCLLLPGILYFGKFVDRINLSPAYFYDFFTSVFNTYLLMYVIIGLIMIVVANILAFLKIKKH